MNKTKIIAEIGNTHEGSVGLAKKFIEVAADCGVDAIKFQTHIFDAESLPNAPNPPYFKDETRKQYFERTAFNLEQYIILKEYAENHCGVEFISSPFSIEAVDLLLSIGVKTIKIPSGEVTNTPMLEYIAAQGCNTILSSGMSSWEELDNAVSILQNKCNLTVLQCTSEYPCAPKNAGLNIMLEIKEKYKCDVGFSDHTLGFGVPIAAVTLGAKVIEKHFTLSKKMYGSDAKNSIEPDELKLLVQSIREAEIAITTKLNKDEIIMNLHEMKMTFQKSIVSRNELKKGRIIKFEDLCFKKPGVGIEASKYKHILNKKLLIDVEKNHLFNFKDFE